MEDVFVPIAIGRAYDFEFIWFLDIGFPCILQFKNTTLQTPLPSLPQKK
jgi:hypothetical protein